MLVNRVAMCGEIISELSGGVTTEGKKFVTCGLVTREMPRKLENGSTYQETYTHNLIFWNKLAEVAVRDLRKGSLVVIEGKLVHHTLVEELTKMETVLTQIMVTDLIHFKPSEPIEKPTEE